MEQIIEGIHHITAIASDPQQNIDFYTGVLGLRLVKITVNYDDPGSYHLYYGDELGRPGTALTFFAWPGGGRGRLGTSQVTATAFSVPAASLGFWIDRLKARSITFAEPAQRFNMEVLAFYDPDGLLLELVAHDQPDSRSPWLGGGVPGEHDIRGFVGATLSEEGYEQTAQLLTETMGLRQTDEKEGRFRFAVGSGGPGATIDVHCRPDAPRGLVSVGTVHHIAWRTPSDDQQAAWRERMVDLDYNVSPVMDRQYFHSIYFREPGGILFEIATDGPGFTADEAPEALGTTLRLPSWLERARPLIEAQLPSLTLPKRSEQLA